MVKEIEMMDAKADRDGQKCPTCRKPLAKVGRSDKFRCSNPGCPVVFVRTDDDRKTKFRSRSRWGR
jgi:tRNA(Ile2) C34 agmatinyltransferase TiaS